MSTDKKTKFWHVMKFGLKILLITLSAITINTVFAIIFKAEWLFILGLILLPTISLIIALLIDKYVYWGDIENEIKEQEEKKFFERIIEKIKRREVGENKKSNKDNRKNDRSNNSSNRKSVLHNRKTNMGNDNGSNRKHRRRTKNE